jgi:pimeloyl-ACP methyl ester carboxylesterase
MRAAALLLLTLATGGGCIGIPVHGVAKKHPLPEHYGRLPHEWVEIPAHDGTPLRGIFFQREGAPIVLLLHGSGMGVTGKGSLRITEILNEGGYAVLSCDHRGSGYSGGSAATSRYLDEDAAALWAWVLERSGNRPAGVLGISIGTVAAGPLLSHARPPAAAVLERPVDPVTTMSRYAGQYAGFPAEVFAGLGFHPTSDVDLGRCLAAAETDVLLVLPEYDNLMPPHEVEELLADAAPGVETVTLRGGHLTTYMLEPAAWRRAVLDFLDARLRPGRPPAGGREVPADPAGVLDARLDGRTLRLELDREDLPERISVLLCGRWANARFEVANPRRVMRFELPRRLAGRLDPLAGARVVPGEFRPTRKVTDLGELAPSG